MSERPQFTPEEDKVLSTRTLSDAELIKGGAEYKNGILQPTGKQVQEIKSSPKIQPEKEKAEQIAKLRIDLFTPIVEGNRINSGIMLEQISKINQGLSNNPDRILDDPIMIAGYIFRRPEFKGGGVAPEVVEQIRSAQDETRRRLEEEFKYREIPIIPGQTRFDYHLHEMGGERSDYVYTENRTLNEVIESVRNSGCIQTRKISETIMGQKREKEFEEVKLRAQVRIYTTDLKNLNASK